LRRFNPAAAAVPEGLPADEPDPRRLDADGRQSLRAVRARTLDRLLAPLRMQLRRRGGPRPGNLLRQRLPLRGEWTEEGPGWLELDPVALCGGARDDRPCGGSTEWTSAPIGRSRARWKTAASIAL